MKKFLQIIESVFFPASCFGCAHPIGPQNRLGLCIVCLHRLKRNPSPRCEDCGFSLHRHSSCSNGVSSSIRSIRFPLEYEDFSKKLIQKYKISSNQSSERTVEHLLEDFVPKIQAVSYDAVVPIPSRSAFRGGPSAPERIASFINKKCGVPIEKAFSWRRGVKKQTDLSREERLKNLRNALFVKAKSRAAKWKSVLVVDDVMTTGATAQEAARTLKESGAQNVDLLVLGRTKLNALSSTAQMGTRRMGTRTSRYMSPSWGHVPTGTCPHSFFNAFTLE